MSLSPRKETDLDFRACIVLVVTVLIAIGCAQRTGVAYLQIENDQSGNGGRAERHFARAPLGVKPRRTRSVLAIATT